MHSEVRVVKEAVQQLRKALSWTRPLVDVEWLDEELVERLNDALEEAASELSDAITSQE